MMSTLTRRALLALSGVTVAGAGRAQAQQRSAAGSWPSQPIRILQSGSAGGTSDILMRVIGEVAQPVLGQNFVIEPRPGGGGIIAMNATKAAPADGHTFFVNHTQTHAFGPTLYAGRLPYDPLRDFTAVCRLVAMPNLLYVRADHPARTVAELIEWLKANPSRASFSTSGPGASTHMGQILFSNLSGVPMTYVMYRGSAPSVQAVLTGDVPASIENMIAVSGFIRNGQVRPLGVTSAARAPQMSDVPAIGETLRGYDISSWFGVIGPAGIPAPVVERFSVVLRDAMATPRITARLLELGAIPAWLGPAQYEAFMAQEIERWAPIVRASGVRPD